jgi:acetate---CoA ligase (ADP-forming)
MAVEHLLRPRSIAIVGASDKPSPGRSIIASLDALGFDGEVYPINPNYQTILGHHVYPTIADLPDGIDLAAFCIGNTRLLVSFAQLARKGLQAATVYASGFGEAADEASLRLNDALIALCRAHGVALCGPNCMGVLNPVSRSSAYLHEINDTAPLAGNVALISQSGSICIAMLADCRRYGFSHVISSGNEAVLSTSDYLEFLIDDQATTVIAMFIETVNQPDRFVALLDHATDAGKPVVVLKAGKSDRAVRAIRTHTGGLAGEAKVLSAVLKAHRAIEVADIDELCEVLAACQGHRWPQGRHLSVVTGSGGQAELILDRATAAGLYLPPLSEDERARASSVIGPLTGDGNPLDAWGSGDFRRNYPHALGVLGASSTYDAVALCTDGLDDQPLHNPGNNPLYAEIVARIATQYDKPFYFMTTRAGLFRRDQERILRQAGVALIGGTVQGLAAIDRLARWAAPVHPARPQCRYPDIGPIDSSRRMLHEYDAKHLLSRVGVPTVPERLVTNYDEAEMTAKAIGFPVVLKVVSDEIAHKSDLGLVMIGLCDENALIRTWAGMEERLDALSPRPQIAGFLVQKMIGGGVEMFVGVSRDRDFGPVLALGLGGIFIEIVREATLRTLPLHEGDAEAMVAELPIASTLLDGTRGASPADTEALCACIYAVGDFAYSMADQIAEIDINPVKVLPRGQGCFAVDALIVPRRL